MKTEVEHDIAIRRVRNGFILTIFEDSVSWNEEGEAEKVPVEYLFEEREFVENSEDEAPVRANYQESDHMKHAFVDMLHHVTEHLGMYSSHEKTEIAIEVREVEMED